MKDTINEKMKDEENVLLKDELTAMADAALEGGLDVLGYTSQARFLINAGLPALIADIDPADPVVAQRLRIQQQLYVAQITDPVLRSAQGSAQLAQTTRREANVRGFNDVFTLSGWLAIGFLCWLLLLSLRTAVLKQWRKRHPTSPAVATPAAPR